MGSSTYGDFASFGWSETETNIGQNGTHSGQNGTDLPTPPSFGSFTRINDERQSIDTQSRNLKSGFERLELFETTQPRDNACRPPKTMSNRNKNTSLRPSMRETNADVENYFTRPPPISNRAQGTMEPIGASLAYNRLGLHEQGNEKDCPPITEISSILDNPKDQTKEQSTFQFATNALFFDPQYPITTDQFTRPMQSRDIVKDVYKRELCKNVGKQRTIYTGSNPELLSNDFATKVCKQENDRKAGVRSLLLGTAQLVPLKDLESASKAPSVTPFAGW